MKNTIVFISIAVVMLVSCNDEKKASDTATGKTGSDPASSTDKKEEAVILPETAVRKYPVPGEFHKMLARSNGTWKGEGTMWFFQDAPPITGTSMLTNRMTTDGLYQVSEIKGNTTPGMGDPWTGLRITGYDNERKVFTRAMIGDGGAAGGVGMEGPWDETTQSMTMPFKKVDPSSGEERSLKEVYKVIDENTEVLEIYSTDPKTKKEFKMLNIKWTRIK